MSYKSLWPVLIQN